MHNLIRTFHPIGQGAFYSERHLFDNNEFTIVYDCGSTTLDKRILEKKIKSTFPKNTTIDILFISHFHTDHINGIEFLKNQCKIKKVVLPLLSEQAKILLKISNFLNHNDSDTQLYDDPAAYFGEGTTVLQVSEIDADNINDSNNQLNIIKSGFEIKPDGSSEWVFLPYNYKQTDRKIQFIDALQKNSGLNLSDIDTIEKISTHIKSIRKAYNFIDGGLNENSMILFSGNKSHTYQLNSIDQISISANNRMQEINAGCIYLGDITLRTDFIAERLKKELIKSRIFENVGTVQIPHHGSIYDFDNSILIESKIKSAIVSFGTNNDYGHPSDRVIADIISRDIDVSFVTEEQKTIIVQYNKKEKTLSSSFKGTSLLFPPLSLKLLSKEE